MFRGNNTNVEHPI